MSIITKTASYQNFGTGITPIKTFAAPTLSAPATGGAVGGFLSKMSSGDIIGTALSLVGTIGGLFDGSNHRDDFTSRKLAEVVGVFESSRKQLSDINFLYKELYDIAAYEKTKEGQFEKKYYDFLVPITQELEGMGYTVEWKTMTTRNRNTQHQYPVWSEPISKEFINGASEYIKQGGGMSMLGMAGIGLLGYMLLKGKK